MLRMLTNARGDRGMEFRNSRMAIAAEVLQDFHAVGHL